MNLLSDSALNPFQSALRKFVQERVFCCEGWAWLERGRLLWGGGQTQGWTTSHQGDACSEGWEGALPLRVHLELGCQQSHNRHSLPTTHSGLPSRPHTTAPSEACESEVTTLKGGLHGATWCVYKHHVYKGTRNEAHMSPSQGSQLWFTEMSSWCATLLSLTASVEISVFPAAAE